MEGQVVQLKRSDKNYIAGFRSAIKRINKEWTELLWFDKNLELLRQGKITELRQLWITTDRLK